MRPEEQLQLLAEAEGDAAALALITVDLAFPEVDPADRAHLKRELETAAIPHWFDDKILRALLEERAAHDLDRLRTLSVVEAFPARGDSAMNVHEGTRLALRKRLAVNEPRRFADLSGTAAQWFESYRDPAGQIEHIYHLLSADPEVGAADLEVLLRRWELVANPEDLTALGRVADELERESLVRGKARAWVLLTVAAAMSMRGEDGPELRSVAVRARQHAEEAGDQVAGSWADAYEVEALIAAGNVENGSAVAARSLATRRRIDRERSTRDSRVDVASALSQLGGIAADQGDVDLANKNLSENLEILTQLLAEHPNDRILLQLAAIAENALGNLWHNQGRTNEALAAQRRFLEGMQKIVDEEPNRDRLQREYAIAHHAVGGCLLDLGDTGEAVSALHAALAILERLARCDSPIALWETDLAEIHRTLGDALVAHGNYEEAQASYEQDLAIIQRLAAKNPDSPEIQLSLSASHNRIGGLLEMQDALWEAQAAFEQSLRVTRRLAARDANNSSWQRELAISRQRLGAILRVRGEKRAARREMAAAYRILRRLTDEHPDSAKWQADLAATESLAPRRARMWAAWHWIESKARR